MKVHKLTASQAKLLVGVEYIENCTYNPIDTNGNWIITTDEVNQTTNEDYLWVKDLPLIDYKP